MATEIKKLRQLLYEWLKDDVTALTTLISDRVYPLWPPDNAVYPCAAYNIRSRETTNDFGAPTWGGFVEVYLFDPSQDTLDDMEDAIVEYVSNNPETINTTLSDTSTVLTSNFKLMGVEQDPRDAWQEDTFLVITRVLRFELFCVKRIGAWA